MEFTFHKYFVGVAIFVLGSEVCDATLYGLNIIYIQNVDRPTILQ